jgi:hypothetical protein
MIPQRKTGHNLNGFNNLNMKRYEKCHDFFEINYIF